MTVLVLRLAGPLQSWGSSSRFARRTTESAPTKSGVLGLLAAAQGRRRTDPLEDLAGLRFAVRVDQPGRLTRDFQTARSLDGKVSLPLTVRYYLADAVFLAMVEGDSSLLAALGEALSRPVFPLYLGRRSCPPAGPLIPRLIEGTIEDALVLEPWSASSWYQRRDRSSEVRVEAVFDCPPGWDRAETLRDQPLSFDPERRQYGWRSVRRQHVSLRHPLVASSQDGASSGIDGQDPHDPLGELSR